MTVSHGPLGRSGLVVSRLGVGCNAFGTRIDADQVRDLEAAWPAMLEQVRGQVEVASTAGQVVSVHLEPEDPTACPETLEAVRAADWVVLGPGSWFSSVIPHLLVPALRDALVASAARKVVTLNLEPQSGETEGFSPETHLEVLSAHAPELKLDVVLADEGTVSDVAGLRAVAVGPGRQASVFATAAVAAYTHRLTGAQDLVLGLPVTARSGPDMRATAGMLARIAPMMPP